MTWYQDLETEARDEAAIIVEAFDQQEPSIVIGGVARNGGVGFMYAEDQLLIREQYLGNIEPILRRRGRQALLNKRVIKDIVLLDVPPSQNGDKSAESNDSASEGNSGNGEGNDGPSESNGGNRGSNDGPSESNGGNRGGNDGPPDGNGEPSGGELPALVRLVEEIDAELGPGIATLNHVLTVAPGSPSPCPATEPEEVYDPRPFPPLCRGDGGDRVRIYVADTGWVPGTVATCSWLSSVSPASDNDPRVAGGTISHYGAHGTFVAGVIACLAPGAEILVKNVFNIAGSKLEADFVPELRKGFDYGAEIFHLTVASPTMHNRPLMAFGAWLEELRQHKGVVCVVAAGNNGDRLPCWPAAFRGVISVGALSADWRSRRAYFSNYGGWVDVYAPGQNLVNAFATGTYTCQVAPHAGETRTFSGMAQWSGTSFSTPVVTGLIAARMARCGESGQEAAAALLAEARAQAIPGVGPVLYPHCGDGGDRRCGRCGGEGRRCGCGGNCGCGGGRGHHGDCGCGSGCRLQK